MSTLSSSIKKDKIQLLSIKIEEIC